jgi:hypothetical protein
MIGTTNPQLPKYIVKVITSTKTKPTPPLEMKKEVYQQIRGAFRHFKKIDLKSLPNMQMKVKSKEVSRH